MADEVTASEVKASKTKAKVEEKKAEKKSPYAVIKTGGKQYIVRAGDKIKVELLGAEEGATVRFDDVLLASNTESDALVKSKSTPTLKAQVVGKVLGTVRTKKVLIFKKRRKGGYTKKQGHRQDLNEVLIESVTI